MRFRNAYRLSVDNFGSVFKLLLYRLVTGVIFFSLIYVILKLALASVMESAELKTIKALIGEFFNAIATGQSERLHVFQEEFHAAALDFVAMLGRHSASIAGVIVGVCLMYILSRFANGLAVFAIGNTINDRMSVFARTPFSSAYFKNITQAMLYQLIYVPLSFIYDALCVAACWLFFFYAPSFLPSAGVLSMLIELSLTFTAVVCLEALKMTIVSSWMPSMIADKLSVIAGLKQCFRKKDFARRFGGFVVAIYCIVIINIVCAITTFGSALFISVPMSFIFLLAMQFVNYYRLYNRKFFVSLHKIVGGDEEPEDLIES